MVATPWGIKTASAANVIGWHIGAAEMASGHGTAFRRGSHCARLPHLKRRD